jgi:glycerol uptake facilitator-like aquaporin
MKKYLVESIGTFFLVFTIGSTVMAPGRVRSLRSPSAPRSW